MCSVPEAPSPRLAVTSYCSLQSFRLPASFLSQSQSAGEAVFFRRVSPKGVNQERELFHVDPVGLWVSKIAASDLYVLRRKKAQLARPVAMRSTLDGSGMGVNVMVPIEDPDSLPLPVMLNAESGTSPKAVETLKLNKDVESATIPREAPPAPKPSTARFGLAGVVWPLELKRDTPMAAPASKLNVTDSSRLMRLHPIWLLPPSTPSPQLLPPSWSVPTLDAVMPPSAQSKFKVARSTYAADLSKATDSRGAY